MAEWTTVIEKPLVYGGTFEERASTIRAMIFGVMLEIAEGKISMYRSDLFHDALWINAHVSGPTTFYWIHRDSGTHIGDEDFIDVAAGVFKDASYRRLKFDLTQESPERWKLIVSEFKEPMLADDPLAEILSAQEVLEEADGTFTEDDQGNWHPVTPETPTPGNAKRDLRKKVSMESLIENLREKKEEANTAKSQLEEYKSNIDQAIDELETYMNEVDDLINSLENVTEVAIEVDLDSVNFES